MRRDDIIFIRNFMKWVLLCFCLWAAPKTYVSLDLEYPGYQKTLKNLDLFLGKNLANRSEAHITVITPPEFKILSEKIPAEQIHQEWDTWKRKSFQQSCLGEGKYSENGKLLKTYYVVINSEDLLAFRKYLKKKYDVTAFNADSFYPHITIGFTEKDLHFEQGVIKDSKSCPKELQKFL